MQGNILGLETRPGKNLNTSELSMSGEEYEKYYDPDDRENYWSDNEKNYSFPYRMATNICRSSDKSVESQRPVGEAL